MMCEMCHKDKRNDQYEIGFLTCKRCNRDRVKHLKPLTKKQKYQQKLSARKYAQFKKDMAFFRPRVGVVHKGPKPYPFK